MIELIENDILTCADEERFAMAYLDPPYNTGSKFVYPDSKTEREWLLWFGSVVAVIKRALQEDGFVCVSIDNNSLLSVMDRMCRYAMKPVANIVVKNNPVGRQMGGGFATQHEYLLVYAKADRPKINYKSKEVVDPSAYSLKDNVGRYRLIPLKKTNLEATGDKSPTMRFPIVHQGQEYWPEKNGTWRWGRDTVRARMEDLVFKNGRVFQRQRLTDETERKLPSIWDDVGSTTNAVEEIKERFGDRVFQTPKPMALMKRILGLCPKPGPVLDGFSGSGTTLECAKILGYDCVGYQCRVDLDPNNSSQALAHKWCVEHGAEPRLSSLTRYRMTL